MNKASFIEQEEQSMPKTLFSAKLEKWLAQKKSKKTLANLQATFGARSFAVAFVLLMAIPALPLPTGGVTHIFEIMTMLLALELIMGRRTIWLPENWSNRGVGLGGQKTITKFLRFIRWVERRVSGRLGAVRSNKVSLRLIGTIIFVLALTAFIAPPFSGLDTLPALGSVFVSLSLLLDSMVLLPIGMLVGVAGIAVEIGASSLIVYWFRR